MRLAQARTTFLEFVSHTHTSQASLSLTHSLTHTTLHLITVSAKSFIALQGFSVSRFAQHENNIEIERSRETERQVKKKKRNQREKENDEKREREKEEEKR